MGNGFFPSFGKSIIIGAKRRAFIMLELMLDRHVIYVLMGMSAFSCVLALSAILASSDLASSARTSFLYVFS